MFTIYSDSGFDSTMVSNLFIDEYMKSANDAQIKIYLYLLRMMGAHRPTSVSDLADQFNHTEKDVVRSLRYWEKKGLLDLTFRRDPACAETPAREEELVSVSLRRPSDADRKTNLRLSATRALSASASGAVKLEKYGEAPAAGAPAMAGSEEVPGAGGASAGWHEAASGAEAAAVGRREAVPGAGAAAVATDKNTPGTGAAGTGGREAVPGAGAAKAGAGRETPDELEVLERFRQNARKEQLLFVVEQYIGKPLSLREIRSIYHLSEELRFSDEMIDYLLQYCIDRGKRDFRYICKVAENWAKSGISTPSQAEASEAAGRPAGSEAAPGSGLAAGTGNAPAGRAAAPALKKGRRATRPRSSNTFNQFEQNRYDFDALEAELLEDS